MPALERALHDALARAGEEPVVLWLILDRLDSAPVPQGGARELLDELYATAARIDVLRIVLIGLPGAVPGIESALCEVETLAPPDAVDPSALEYSLGCLLTDRDLAPAAHEIARHASLALRIADLLREGDGTRNRLEHLSWLMSRAHLPTAGSWSS